MEAYDGSGNNVANPTWGSDNQRLLRHSPQAYGDGLDTPAGADRPSARAVSDALCANSADAVISSRDLTTLWCMWGQFMDHDLSITPTNTADPLPIPVPTGDPWFDPTSTGTKTMSFFRSTFDPTTGGASGVPRAQISSITAFIDGTQVYGPTAARASALRTFVGGKMNTSEGNLLPYNTLGLPNGNDAHVWPDAQLYLAGDKRANENPGLTAMHTLFVREHNRCATAAVASDPTASDEAVYQRCRRFVIALLQKVTYDEFLPALLGKPLPPYTGYDASVNTGVTSEVSGQLGCMQSVWMRVFSFESTVRCSPPGASVDDGLTNHRQRHCTHRPIAYCLLTVLHGSVPHGPQHGVR